MKKLVALMLAIALCASLAAIPAAMADETIKITIFVDGTIPDQAATLSKPVGKNCIPDLTWILSSRTTVLMRRTCSSAWLTNPTGRTLLSCPTPTMWITPPTAHCGT